MHICAVSVKRNVAPVLSLYIMKENTLGNFHTNVATVFGGLDQKVKHDNMKEYIKSLCVIFVVNSSDSPNI